MAGIREDIRNSFSQGDALTRIILINLGVFVFYLLLKITSFLFQVPLSAWFVEWTALPNRPGEILIKPWTFLTYMFLHESFLHIFFNLLWLYFAGRIFIEYLGGRRLVSTYLIGGLLGGLLYVLAYNIFPVFEGVATNNRGASAGVMAVVIAIATHRPQYPVKLFFVLTLPLWGIAALALLADLIYLGEGNNAGGHIAHLGGAIFGFLSVRSLRQGYEWTAPMSRLLDRLNGLFKPSSPVRKVYSKPRNDNAYRARKVQDQQKMDAILDKISRSGYDSLSQEEKDYLFKIGKD